MNLLNYCAIWTKDKKKRKSKTFWGIYVGHDKQDYGWTILGRYITLDWKYESSKLLCDIYINIYTTYALEKGLQRMLIY